MTELNLVVLKEPVLVHGLVTGGVGTMVHRYDDEKASEVKFVDNCGTTIVRF